MQVINKLIQKLGKDGYTVDPSLSGLDIFIIMSGKFMALLRGFYLKIWLKKSGGLVFVGRHCRIKHCNKIRLGKTVTIGDNVEINALSRNGIQMGNNVS
ncbi:MAG: hypothetical protein ABUL44_01785, partial [Flavobacterium sp.]